MLYHILTVPPQREFKAAEAVKALGAEIMLPVEYRWHDVRKAGGTKRAATEKLVKPYPLWPRYVFAGFSSMVPWRELYSLQSGSAHLVTGALHRNGMPYALNHVERLQIRSLCDIEAPMVPPNAAPRLAVGDRVRIVDGPFKGTAATVTKVARNRETIRAMVSLFGVLTEASVPMRMVEAA